MAARYWIGDSGNWNDTANWSTSSGGGGGASVPTNVDDVYLDANSFTSGGTITVDIDATCLSFNASGLTVTGVTLYSIAFQLSVYGSAIFSANLNVQFVTEAEPFNFVGTGATNTITFNGCGWDVARTNVGTTTSTYTLQDNWITTRTSVMRIYLTGTVDLNDNDFDGSSGSLFLYDSDLTMLYMGSGTTTIPYWYVNSAYVEAETSELYVSTTFNVGNGTFYNVYLGDLSIGGAPTFNNLTVTGSDIRHADLVLQGDITVNNDLTLIGSDSGANRLLIQSNNTTQRTITVNGTLTATNTDFHNIAGAGSADWNLSGITGLCGDGGGNSGITFSAPLTLYYVGNTNAEQSFSENKWALTSSGTTGQRVPILGDTAIFDENSFPSPVNFRMNIGFVPSVDFSRVTQTGVTYFMYWGSLEYFGDFILNSNIVMDVNRNYPSYFKGAGDNIILTGTQFEFDNIVYIRPVDGGTYTLKAPLNLDSLNASTGGFFPNSYTITTTGTVNAIYETSGLDTSLGDNLVTNGEFTSSLSGWTGTNWAWDSAYGGSAKHTTGSTGSLYTGFGTTDTDTYLIRFRVFGRTQGQIRPLVGNSGQGTYVSTNDLHEQTIVSGGIDDLLRLQPSSDFDGWVDDVEVYKYEQGSTLSATATGIGNISGDTSLGAESIADGDFNSNAKWTEGSAWNIHDGVASYDNSGGSGLDQDGADMLVNFTEVNKTYVATVVASGASLPNTYFYLRILDTNEIILNRSTLNSGVNTFEFTTPSESFLIGSGGIRIVALDDGAFDLLSFSIRESDPQGSTLSATIENATSTNDITGSTSGSTTLSATIEGIGNISGSSDGGSTVSATLTDASATGETTGDRLSSLSRISTGTAMQHLLNIYPGTTPANVPSITSVNITSETGVGVGDGAITISASGGTVPYQYSIGGSYQVSPTFTGLNGGKYVISVRDVSGYTDTISGITIPTAGSSNIPIITELIIGDISKAGASDGSISIIVTGGVTPYLYALNNDIYQSSNVFNGLGNGTYIIKVKDADGTISQLGGVRIGGTGGRIGGYGRGWERHKPYVTVENIKTKDVYVGEKSVKVDIIT